MLTRAGFLRGGKKKSVGNPGRPGRPPRAIEADYLRTMAEAVTLDDWREIAAKAVSQAKGGAPAAREWLTRYLVGREPPKLLDLAAAEQLGVDPVAERCEVIRYVKTPDSIT